MLRHSNGRLWAHGAIPCLYDGFSRRTVSICDVARSKATGLDELQTEEVPDFV